MKTKLPALIIPVENQVREFDAKLLLALIAAKRGFKVFIGDRQEIKSRIASFPVGILFAKDMMSGNVGMFKIIRKLGHVIVAWDEDSLVHLPPETYYSRRLSPDAVRHVSHLFAWGQKNVDLWRGYPELPPEMPIHITGNPRGDLLRSEMRELFDDRVQQLKREHGDYILINTNFNHVNAFSPNRNLFIPAADETQPLEFGRAAVGMRRAYAEGLFQHKKAVLNDFLNLMPYLDERFPNHRIIVRPHPVENPEIYQRVAANCQNVHVTNSGNVVPWLMASQALIHNSCTTAVEAFAINKPAIAFRATVNDQYDMGFYQLPNRLSLQCFSYQELASTLAALFKGTSRDPAREEKALLFQNNLGAQDGPLACERIIATIEKQVGEKQRYFETSLKNRIKGWLKAKKRARKRLKKYQNAQYTQSQEFLNHRYPYISLETVTNRVHRFDRLINLEGGVKIKEVFKNVYCVAPE
jgi:surface carbohydrate biosynthesis protein